MIGSELHRYKDQQKYCVIDLETESLSLGFSRPWQVGWLICTNKEILERHSEFISWPDLKVSDEAARVTRFNKKLYDSQAKPADEVLARFETDLYNPDYFIVGHHVLFYDSYIHNVWRKLLGKEEDFSWLARLIDTNCLAKGYRQNIRPDHTNLLQWMYKIGATRGKFKTSLGSLAKEFAVQHDDMKMHDAPEDIIVNWLIWKELQWKVEI
jgi:DNA polymerase III alpha subunit (gram-positive type)